MPEFVHLHNHSDYSLQDAAARVSDLVNAAVEHKMKAVALTDHGNISGAIKFFNEAISKGIKPIIGMEAYITIDGDRFSKGKAAGEDDDYTSSSKRQKNYNHLILLVKNEEGFRNLSILSSKGYLEGFYYKPRIDFELLKQHSKGLICLSACPAGILSYHILNNDYDKAVENAIKYKELFGDDFYIELQNHNMDIDEILLEALPKIARKVGVKLVATNDVHYIKPEHAIPHNVLLQISNSRGQSDYRTLRYGTDQIYFKSAEEMVKLFKDYPDAIENTLEITDKVVFEFKKEKYFLPDFKIPENDDSKSLDEYLTKLVFDGLKERFGDLTPEIEDRANYELGIIKQMGFSGYFLIVMDIIRMAKERNIAVGPGRGSGAGSLVSYALGITNVNPLKYGLIFERFLNPERVTMPDIDTDFAFHRRDEIINLIVEKYGKDRVAQIVTFNRLMSRQIIKDVGRVLSIPIKDVEKITKHIKIKFGKVMSLKQAIEEVPELAYLKNPPTEKERELIEYSMVLENMNRNLSVHASGVVIAPDEITKFTPLCITSDKKVVTQFDMNDIEKIGLVKIDILGLKTLTLIQQTLEIIKQTKNIELNISDIPLDDEETFELFAQGRTVGIFQFDKPHTQEFLKRLKPTSIAELSAMNALNRPGPMEFIDEFIERKHGKKPISYLLPELEPILKETYGIIVYQEQVMRIAHEVIGYSLAKADLMRRAMGKKDEKILAALRNEFISEGEKRGHPKDLIEKLFDEIYRFKDYGFNKSHSVAYSILSFQVAYLKAHFPHEFMVASLSLHKNDKDKVALFLNECRKSNIDVLPPDVNKSGVDFTIDDNKIRFGLSAIKNIGESAAEEIIQVRKVEPFKDIFDFCMRVDLRTVNKRAIEGLIYAGAFDSLHPNRAQLKENIDEILDYCSRAKEKKSLGLVDLFDNGVEDSKPSMKKTREWNLSETMQHEYDVLGFFVSGHPLLEYEILVRSFSNISFADVVVDEREEEGENGNSDYESQISLPEKIAVCVVLVDIETKMYNETQTMATLKVNDLTGQSQFIMFDTAYQKYGKILKKFSSYYMIGRGEIQGSSLKVRVDEVYPIEEVINKFGEALSLEINISKFQDEHLDKLYKIFKEHEGNKPFYIKMNYSNSHKEFFCSSLTVNLTNKLIKELSTVIPPDNITIHGKNSLTKY